jgi:hypothetical protein
VRSLRDAYTAVSRVLGLPFKADFFKNNIVTCISDYRGSFDW